LYRPELPVAGLHAGDAANQFCPAVLPSRFGRLTRGAQGGGIVSKLGRDLTVYSTPIHRAHRSRPESTLQKQTMVVLSNVDVDLGGDRSSRNPPGRTVSARDGPSQYCDSAQGYSPAFPGLLAEQCRPVSGPGREIDMRSTREGIAVSRLVMFVPGRSSRSEIGFVWLKRGWIETLHVCGHRRQCRRGSSGAP